MTDRSALLALAVTPRRSGLFTDFDGTLSEIVDDPASATLVPGALDALVALADRLGRVVVVSGRPRSYLEPIVPSSIDIAGLYGLELRVGGVARDHPQAGAWREVVADVVEAGRASSIDGMRTENKGLSLTLHYRGRPEIAERVHAWAEQQGARSGLEVRPAKMSIELHPPIDADKGTTIEQLAVDLDAIAYVGDDLGDLPAFDALDRLAAAGRRAVKVAVRGTEPQAALVDRADVVADGPTGALDLLRELLDAVS